MSDKITRARYPWTTTTPAALSALDLGNVNVIDFRPVLWRDRPDDMWERAIENDWALIAFLQSQNVKTFEMGTPVVKYRVTNQADMWTYNDVAIAAADIPAPGSAGYISVDDSMLVGANTLLHFVDYGVVLRVLDVDDDNSEGWTVTAGGAANCKVERIGGPAVAIAINTICQAGSVAMGELGTPGPGHTTTPGSPVFNTVQLVGRYGNISKMQLEADMNGRWGTHPKVKDEIWFQHMHAKQYDILFGQRYFGTDSQGDQGQMWLANGLVPQISTYVYNAGSLGVNLDPVKFNDYAEQTFDSQNSSLEKDLFCGSGLFRDMRKCALQGDAITMAEMPALRSGVQDPGTLGANQMTIQLQSGKVIRVHELRRAFQKNLANWGVMLDNKNVEYGTYKGISEVWYENIEAPIQAITKRTDALVDTWCPIIHDESTCMLVAGGTPLMVE